jgi:hypothetical protein
MTVDAGRGAPSPDAAADAYLGALSYNNDEGLLPLLDNDHQKQLLAQWRAYRDAMQHTKPPPFRLDYGSLAVGPVAHGQAEVGVDVAATWWSADTNGRLGGYRSHDYPWLITTAEDDGWRVSAVAAPAWCGGYVRKDACAAG